MSVRNINCAQNFQKCVISNRQLIFLIFTKNSNNNKLFNRLPFSENGGGGKAATALCPRHYATDHGDQRALF